MGIISILFLVFGWIFSVKGLIITSLCLSAVFSLFLTIGIFFEKSNEDKFSCLFNDIIQFVVLILSIVKLAKGF